MWHILEHMRLPSQFFFFFLSNGAFLCVFSVCSLYVLSMLEEMHEEVDTANNMMSLAERKMTRMLQKSGETLNSGKNNTATRGKTKHSWCFHCLYGMFLLVCFISAWWFCIGCSHYCIILGLLGVIFFLLFLIIYLWTHWQWEQMSSGTAEWTYHAQKIVKDGSVEINWNSPFNLHWHLSLWTNWFKFSPL